MQNGTNYATEKQRTKPRGEINAQRNTPPNRGGEKAREPAQKPEKDPAGERLHPHRRAEMEREETGGRQPAPKERAYTRPAGDALRRALVTRQPRLPPAAQLRLQLLYAAIGGRVLDGYDGSLARIRRLRIFCRSCATSHFLLGDENIAPGARLPLQRGPSWVFLAHSAERNRSSHRLRRSAYRRKLQRCQPRGQERRSRMCRSNEQGRTIHLRDYRASSTSRKHTRMHVYASSKQEPPAWLRSTAPIPSRRTPQ